MKNQIALMYLAVSGSLILATGCGKSDNATPSTKEAVSTDSVSKAESTPMSAPAASTATQLTNAMADTAKPAADTAARTANAAVTPLTEVPAKAAEPPPASPAPAPSVTGQAKAALASLSQDQVAQGLTAALSNGLQQAVAALGHDDGFLTNLNVKIPMPDKLQKVESILRAAKQQKLADDFVTTMNRAAEQAVPEAGSVFADALKRMTIDDAKSILTGPDDAATQYFQKATQTNLYARFYPIVQKATEKAGVTSAYKKVMEKANIGQSLGALGGSLGGTLLGKDTVDIDAYVTNKALDGLFKMVAQEERRIRQNPVARTTDVLQKVFGALKK